MESKIISVERILQYTSIPSEPPLVINENQPDPSWPSNGEVDIQDLQVVQAITFLVSLVSFDFFHSEIVPFMICM